MTSVTEEESRGRRVQRAKDALSSLELAGHDVRSGVTIDIGCGRVYLAMHFLSVGIVALGVDLSKAVSSHRAEGCAIRGLYASNWRELNLQREILQNYSTE